MKALKDFIYQYGSGDMIAEFAKLQAIVEKLPVTRDGVRVVPGWDTVWKWFPSRGEWSPCEVEIPQPYNEADYDYVGPDEVPHCYSTIGAADAAKKTP